MNMEDNLSASIETVCSSYKKDREFKRALEKLIKNVAEGNYLEEDLVSLINRIK